MEIYTTIDGDGRTSEAFMKLQYYNRVELGMSGSALQTRIMHPEAGRCCVAS